MININNRVVDEITEINVMNDEKVVRLDFKCKNQVTELLKLTDCTLFINYQNGSTKDRYAVNDLTLDGEYVTFSWTLGRNATKSQGKTFFVVCAVKTEGSTVVQEWNSVLTSFEVKKGLETITAPTEDMQDLFAELTAMVESKQNKLIAGDNITIEDDVISASGGGAVDVDNITIEKDNGVLKVKNGGITSAKLSSALNTLINGKAEQYMSLYTPSSQIVNAETLSGKWQAAEGFTLRIGGNTSYEELITVNEGDVFYVDVNSSPYCTGYVDTTYFDFQYEFNGIIILDLTALINSLYQLGTSINDEVEARQTADNNLQGQIDAITVSSDVVDVVGTYTDLVNYDTEHIKANDIIKVLQDSTHNDALSYYRWVITGGVGAWTYVGSEGPFYTKGEADVLLQAKLGTDAVKQSEGQSESDVMSQKAVTNALSGKLSSPLLFSNIAVSDWASNSPADTYFENYTYKAVITCSGVTADMLATVIYADAQEQSGDYSTKCSTGANSVTIYSNDNSVITIPTIVAGVPIEVEVQGGGGHTYSTTEQAVGTWVDGKTIYELSKEIPASTQINNYEFWTISDLDNIVEFSLICNQSNSIFGMGADGTTSVLKRGTGGVLKGETNISFSGKAFAIIRYTKTS